MRALPAIGALLVGVMVLAIGYVLGMARESGRAADVPVPSVVDIGFAQDMSEHHDQAILMSRTLAPDVAPEVRGLADRIVIAQTAETATMRGWLTWFGEPAGAAEPMAWMLVDDGSGAHDHAAAADADGEHPPMPGTATIEEIQRLAAARGVEAEVLFLQLMIRHHRGGIEMATAARDDPRAGEATRRLAESMIVEQNSEIGLMRTLLLARGAELPAG